MTKNLAEIPRPSGESTDMDGSVPDRGISASSTSPSLLRKLRDQGDDASWQRFHRRYAPLLLAVGRRAGLGEADARDVVQDAILDVMRQMPDFQYDRARGRFKNWLLTIVRRRISNHRRREHYQLKGHRIPRTEEMDTGLAETTPAPDAAFERMWAEEWERHVLESALEVVKGQVPPLQYQMFQLHVLKELKVSEVGERLGVKPREVYGAKARVQQLLKAAIDELELELE